MKVAPHVGAWIEMVKGIVFLPVIIVAPHVGAWIEIPMAWLDGSISMVAPHVGAWIEIVEHLQHHRLT